MNRLEDFRAWYTNLWAPWQTSCLPEELAFPERPYLAFEAEKMLRDASLGHAIHCELGIFQILGMDEARRAACIWSPIVRLITQEVSLAFMLVEEQRQTGEIVSSHNVARLVEALHAYFRSVGRPRSRDALQSQVEQFLREHSLADADGISPTRLPVTVNLPLLDELRIVDQELRERFVDWHGRPASLGDLGLRLDEKLDDSRYDWCTPLNCRTFASTGGDGHHFSFLVIDGEITASSPIVATAPDVCGQSVVIAESLAQFLRLGCVHTYDPLGAIFLGSDEEVAAHFAPVADAAAVEFEYAPFQPGMLGYLRQRLNLEPWTDWQALREIQRQHKSLLKLPPDVPEWSSAEEQAVDRETEIEEHVRRTSPACIEQFRLTPAELPEPINESFTTAWQLACKCGNNSGRLLGHRLENLNPEYRGDLYVSPLAFECSACGDVTELLDTDIHGHHAEVAKLEGDRGSAKLRGEGSRTAYACPACSKTVFRMLVGFVYWHFDLVLDEPELPAQEFFNEFLLYCTCSNCGRLAEPTEFGKL